MSTRAGIIELSLGGRGPRRGWVFDPHRLALPCWAEAHGRPSLLITFDRHFDTVPPKNPPAPGLSPEQLDRHARECLDVRNYDHLLAAMEAEVISHAIVVARARPRGAFDGPEWCDSRGGRHQLLSSATLDELTHDFSAERLPSTAPAARAKALISSAESIVLDVDLDCFTTLSDADPTTVVPWPKELIRQHLLPRGSAPFWAAVLPKCLGFTFAREPSHCGGLIASNRLFEIASEIIFEELFETDLP